MRFTRYTTLAMFTGAMLLAPVSAPAAASKEMQELQRDVADAQAQIAAMAKQLTSVQTTLQQAVDAANKTDGNVRSLNTGLIQALNSGLRGLSDQLNSVTGLSTKISGIGDDVGYLQNSVKDLQSTVNRQGLVLAEILDRLKVLQVPVAAPPTVDASGAPGAGGPPPSPGTLFGNAKKDHDTSKFDLALTEFKEFLHLFPNDPNAIRAQYNIGDCYYSLSNLDEAVDAFDAVIERYDKDPLTTPSAYYMKGMALKKLKKNPEAKASFSAVIKQFPQSDEATQAQSQLRSMGVVAAPPARKGR